MSILGPDCLDPLNGAPVAVFDFETTGIDPTQCHPVQVGVVHLDLPKGEPVVAYSTLIKPPVPIPEGASKIHGIYDADVALAPTMAEVLPELMAALEGRLLCAYNLQYDWQVLVTAGERSDFQIPRFCGLDPYVWARQVDKYKKGGKKLAKVCERRGIELRDAHDATADCLATAALVPKLLGEWGRELRSKMGPDQWKRIRPLGSIRNFWEAQCSAAFAVELDFASWRRDQGKPIDSMSWHELLNRPIPPGLLSKPPKQQPEASAGHCEQCGKAVHRMHTGPNRLLQAFDIETIQGIERGKLDRWDAIAYLPNGDTVTIEQAEAGAALQPGERWIVGRTPHYLSCEVIQAANNRRRDAS